MGTIFKYNAQLIQCQNLQKKLKKMKISESDIEIVKDDIPNELLEKEFVELTRNKKEDVLEDSKFMYYIFQNSNGNYLLGMDKPDISHYNQFGYVISDYKLIDSCPYPLQEKYKKWNPETKTGIKDL